MGASWRIGGLTKPRPHQENGQVRNPNRPECAVNSAWFWWQSCRKTYMCVQLHTRCRQHRAVALVFLERMVKFPASASEQTSPSSTRQYNKLQYSRKLSELKRIHSCFLEYCGLHMRPDLLNKLRHPHSTCKLAQTHPVLRECTTFTPQPRTSQRWRFALLPAPGNTGLNTCKPKNGSRCARACVRACGHACACVRVGVRACLSSFKLAC